MPIIPEIHRPISRSEELPDDKIITLDSIPEKADFRDIRGDVNETIVYEVKVDDYQGECGDEVEQFLSFGGRVFGTDKNTFIGVRPNKSYISFPMFLEETNKKLEGNAGYKMVPGKKFELPAKRVRGSVHHQLAGRISAKGLHALGKKDLGDFAEEGGIVFQTDRRGWVLVMPKDSEISFPPGY